MTFRYSVSFRPMDLRQLAAARRDRRPRVVLGRRAGAVHRAVQRQRAHRPAGEGARASPSSTARQGGLTDEGARVVERARRVLHELDDIAADIAPVDGDVSGDVRFGSIGTTARWLLPQLLTEVERRATPTCGSPSTRGTPPRSSHRWSPAGSTPPSSTCRSTDPTSRSSRCSPRTCSSSPTPAIRSPAGLDRRWPSSPRTAPAAAGRHGAAADPRPRRQLRRRRAAGAVGDRRRAPARVAGRSRATARRSSRRRRSRAG